MTSQRKGLRGTIRALTAGGSVTAVCRVSALQSSLRSTSITRTEYESAASQGAQRSSEGGPAGFSGGSSTETSPERNTCRSETAVEIAGGRESLSAMPTAATSSTAATAIP